MIDVRHECKSKMFYITVSFFYILYVYTHILFGWFCKSVNKVHILQAFKCAF